jgi:hypothetical protein
MVKVRYANVWKFLKWMIEDYTPGKLSNEAFDAILEDMGISVDERHVGLAWWLAIDKAKEQFEANPEEFLTIVAEYVEADLYMSDLQKCLRK